MSDSMLGRGADAAFATQKPCKHGTVLADLCGLCNTATPDALLRLRTYVDYHVYAVSLEFLLCLLRKTLRYNEKFRHQVSRRREHVPVVLLRHNKQMAMR